MNPLYQFALFIEALENRFGTGWLFILGIIILLLALAALFLMLSVFSRLGKQRDDQIRIRRQSVFQTFLLDFLYGDLKTGEVWVDTPEVTAFRKKHLRNRFNIQLLIDEIVNLHKGLSGETATRLQELFRHFRLDQQCIAKLNSIAWQVKAAGINELREMRIHEAAPLIQDLVNHSERNVRSNAQIALLELDQSDSRLDFFQDLDFGLTDWDQLRLYESLKSRSGNNPKSFKILFPLADPDIVLFGVRMSNYFGCTQDIKALTELLDHSDPLIRAETILALTNLGEFESHRLLADRFLDEDPHTQLLILKYLEKTQNIDFSTLKNALLSGNHKLSLEAAYQILAYYPDKIAAILDPLPEHHAIRNRFAHAAEPRLFKK